MIGRELRDVRSRLAVWAACNHIMITAVIAVMEMIVESLHSTQLPLEVCTTQWYHYTGTRGNVFKMNDVTTWGG